MAQNCYGVECAGWELTHPKATNDMLGYIPQFLRDDDLRPARDQIDERYGEYGGWRPNRGWKMLANGALQYPGDPAKPPVAERMLRNERIVFYPGAIIAIIAPDGSFEAGKLD